MEAGVVLPLLVALLGTASALSFYGDSVSFMSPQRNKDGTFRVTFHRRHNGRTSCPDQSSFACEGGVCTSFENSTVLQTDQDDTGRGRWCQSEGPATVTVSTNQTSFSLRDSGCCWASNVNGRTQWTTRAQLDLGTRSDSRALNNCPVTATVSSLRLPQNCFSRIRLLAHDPDGDLVRCRFRSDAAVPSNFTLDKATCTLTSAGQVGVGIQVFELMLEDFPSRNITLTYADGTTASRLTTDTAAPPLCRVPLQFMVDILPPIPSCEAGHVQPIFLSKTPSHGELLHATVGHQFQLYAQAQAQHASIHNFQVSGPHNMSKAFKDDKHGKAEVRVSWTPRRSDLYRLVPFCFTADANATQSEMRCVVVMVTQASVSQGKATVECAPNMMKVALEKASMPGIDGNYLKLSDPSCSLSSNSTHITGSMSFSTCGTKLEDKGDVIVFKNEIHSFELPKEVITRRRKVKIGFSCQFPKTISISSYYNIYQSDYIFTESSFGSFGYTFQIFRDGNFTDKVEPSAYPVQVRLLETVFMGIQAQSELPDVKLFVESCKATPDDNPKNPRSYDLIKNGCVEDETLKVHPSEPTLFNFQVQAFKFTGNYDQVYITCSVILCQRGSPFSRCAQGCLRNPPRRRKRDLSRETARHDVTQGPLQFLRDAAPGAAMGDQNKTRGESGEPPAASPSPASPRPRTRSGGAGWEIQQLLDTNVTTAVFATAFLASLVSLAVIIRCLSKKRREEDRKALIVSASDD